MPVFASSLVPILFCASFRLGDLAARTLITFADRGLVVSVLLDELEEMETCSVWCKQLEEHHCKRPPERPPHSLKKVLWQQCFEESQVGEMNAFMFFFFRICVRCVARNIHHYYYILRGGYTEQFIAESEQTQRSVHDALMVVKTVFCNRGLLLLREVGAIEMEVSIVSKYLREQVCIDHSWQKAKLIVSAYANALEVKYSTPTFRKCQI